jgi:hypothetical protein
MSRTQVATIKPSRTQGMPAGPAPRNISHSVLPMRDFIEAAYNLRLVRMGGSWEGLAGSTPIRTLSTERFQTLSSLGGKT